MQPEQIRELLEAVKAGSRGVDEAFTQLAELPYTDIGDAKIDNHRPLRCGFAEVILCRGKEPRDVVRIIEEGLRLGPLMLATRAEKRHIDAIRERYPSAYVNARGGIVRVGQALKMKARGSVVVVTAGTSDIPVAEEALETLRAFGCDGFHNYDVGVAGLHRVLAALPQLREAAVIICVAGMEGALPSVIGGLVACPVIAVPSSVGYGASFNGVAALLGMLNTCSAGVTVVNIDNGFGAAMCALRMVADRDWPMLEAAPAKIETVSAQEVEEAKAAARDGQLVRLEKAIDQLSTMAQKPVVVEAPNIAIHHPNHSEQIARLEKAIAELAAVAAKQKEHDDKKLTAKSAEQNELLARLEKTAHGLAALSNKAVVVESPKIEINHPNQSEQVTRLERAIGELASINAKQKDQDDKKLAAKSTEQNELLARLEKTAHGLAALSNKAVVVESPKIEINHPNQSEQVTRLERAIGELAAIAVKQKEVDEKTLAGQSAEREELLARLEKTAHNLAAVSNRPVVIESPKISITQPNQAEQISRLEKAIVDLAGVAAKHKDDGRYAAPLGNPEQAALLERAIAELNAIAARPAAAPTGVDGEWIARLEKTVEQLAAAAAKPIVVEMKTSAAPLPSPAPLSAGDRDNDSEPDAAEPEASPAREKHRPAHHPAQTPPREIRKHKSPIVKHAAKSKKSVAPAKRSKR